MRGHLVHTRSDGSSSSMLAAVFSCATGKVTVEERWPVPVPAADEALIKVLRAGVCATDLEITRGYVPGYHQPLGHEFVGVVEACSSSPQLVGKRVVGEINCNDAHYSCADAVFQRNHAPGRSVLGIINRGGTMAEYITLPAANLHEVPPELSDAEACFTEPVAAACRILEQGLLPGHALTPLFQQDTTTSTINMTCSSGGSGGSGAQEASLHQPHHHQQQHPSTEGSACSQAGQAGTSTSSSSSSSSSSRRIGVVGDGRLGLLIAQVLALAAPGQVTLFGRHPDKMALVQGLGAVVDRSQGGNTQTQQAEQQQQQQQADSLQPEQQKPEQQQGSLAQWEGTFDLVVEASGSAAGVSDALSLLRPLGTLVLKTTVSLAEQQQPAWAALANDIVVNEKQLVGSRCGPMDVALRVLNRHAPLRMLVNAMLQHEVQLVQAVQGLETAGSKGALKVHLLCDSSA